MHSPSPRLKQLLLSLFALAASALMLCGYTAWNLSSELQVLETTLATQEQMESILISIRSTFLLMGILLVALTAIPVLLWRSAIRPIHERQDFPQEISTEAQSLHQGSEAIPGDRIQKLITLSLAEKKTISAELAASMAHDIRNPLAAIQMSLSNLRADLQDEELAERAERISAEVIRMSRIVTQAVDSTRVEIEESSLIGLSQAVDEIIQLMEFQLRPSITVKNQVPEDLHCNLPQNRFEEALMNLIANSAEAFGEEAGLIRISAEVTGTDLALSVVDDGPGFPEEILKSGGRALTQNRLSGEHFRLIIARRITRDVGGSLQLSNDQTEDGEHGARVVLLLPSCVDDG
jgi:signal transduction histidine kinase